MKVLLCSVGLQKQMEAIQEQGGWDALLSTVTHLQGVQVVARWEPFLVVSRGSPVLSQTAATAPEPVAPAAVARGLHSQSCVCLVQGSRCLLIPAG